MLFGVIVVPVVAAVVFLVVEWARGVATFFSCVCVCVFLHVFFFDLTLLLLVVNVLYTGDDTTFHVGIQPSSPHTPHLAP